MIFKTNKKGAVELSLNLIIMLIIGMVVLGLVISFVTSLVSKGVDSFDNQIGDNEKLKLEEVKNCPKNMCISPSPSINVKKGDKTNIFIKVRAFDTPIDCSAGLLDCSAEDGKLRYVITSLDDSDTTPITLSGPGLKAKVGDEAAQMYTLKAGNDAILGTYYLELTLYTDEDVEVSETITIEVE